MVGTLYYAYRGAAVLESDRLLYWINFSVLPVVSAAIRIGLLCFCRDRYANRDFIAVIHKCIRTMRYKYRLLTCISALPGTVTFNRRAY
jgi:hypothetical protein